MKKFKLSRKVLIVLATIFVLAIGAIIIAKLTNNEAMAYSAGETCPACRSGKLESVSNETVCSRIEV